MSHQSKDRRHLDERGGVAITVALVLPLLLLLVGGAVDYGTAVSQRMRLQAAIDKAALAAAKELGLADARRENVAAVVEANVQATMKAYASAKYPDPTLNTEVRSDPFEVEVVARQVTSSLFGQGFGLVPAVIEANAVARIIGRPNICLLGLDSSASGTISLEKQARVTGNNCAVYSNSVHTLSLKSKNSAVLEAAIICTAGGKEGATGNFTPPPLVDCPTFDDPLAGRFEPTIDPCDASLAAAVTSSQRIYPGTYCGGLRITAGVNVELAAGIYVIKDGAFLVEDGAAVLGKGVGFFLVGDNAVVTFARGSRIDLAAPEGGQMAGLLIFEDRNQPTTGVHEILSDDARNLLGTIYVPKGRLHIDANNPIADKSAYTAIVARQVTLYGGPHLVLNANYGQTDVPVPDGIRGAAQPVALVK